MTQAPSDRILRTWREIEAALQCIYMNGRWNQELADLRDIFDEGEVGLCPTNPDDPPYEAPTWWLFDGDTRVCGSSSCTVAVKYALFHGICLSAEFRSKCMTYRLKYH